MLEFSSGISEAMAGFSQPDTTSKGEITGPSRAQRLIEQQQRFKPPMRVEVIELPATDPETQIITALHPMYGQPCALEALAIAAEAMDMDYAQAADYVIGLANASGS